MTGRVNGVGRVMDGVQEVRYRDKWGQDGDEWVKESWVCRESGCRVMDERKTEGRRRKQKWKQQGAVVSFRGCLY